MYLISGTNSGLGKFLQEELKGDYFCRKNGIKSLTNEPYDAIIHCAFNVSRDVTTSNFSDYINDNLLLTQRLLAIPHKKFIFISTSDVYPRDKQVWKEDDHFPVEKVEGLYGLCKLMVESVVKQQTDNSIILRPTALLGKYSRANSLMKILFNKDTTLTLDANSRFNYILHQDILEFIKIAHAEDITGVFNLAASDSISLGEVANLFKREVKFGSYVYNSANICNKKVTEKCHIFSSSSLDNIKRFHSLMEGSAC